MPISPSTLERIPFFAGIPPEILKALARNFDVREIHASQRICKVGDKPGVVLFVLKGSLQIQEFATDGRLVGVASIAAGGAAGWLPLIDDSPFDCDLVAAEDAEVCFAPNTVLKQLVLQSPLLSERLLTQMASALRRITQDKLGLTLPNAYHRVYAQLHKLIEDPNNTSGRPSLPKQHEIAYMANTSRETVSRALQQLIKLGILTKAGHTLTIKKPDALSRLAHDGPDALHAKLDEA